MHLSSCLVIAGLSTSVHAFYPWELKVSKGISISTKQDNQRRFLPWNLVPERSEENDSQGLTLDIKKFRRDEYYKIVESETPTLENSAAVDQDGKDFSYFATVEVGSQKQEMWLALDTGSPSSWVFSSDCTTETCINHHTFNVSESSSYHSNDSTFSLGYGSGQLKGNLGYDTMSIAGLDATFSFGFTETATKAFDSYPFDGILGLGRSYTGGWEIPSFMDTIADQGVLKNNIIGLSLSRSSDEKKDGEINFGTVDTTKFDGEISYSVTNAETWTIALDDAHVNGQACNFTGKSAIIDSGSTYVFIPPNDAKTFFGLLPGSSQSGDNYLVPCDSTTTVEFEFSGAKYSIKPEDYIGSEDEDDSSKCISTIVSHQSSGANTWLLGDVFLKNVYTVFDFDHGQIGFGTKASADSGNGTYVAPTATASGTIAAATDATSEVSSAAISSGTSTSSTSASDSESTSDSDSATINSAARMSNGVALSLVLTFAALIL